MKTPKIVNAMNHIDDDIIVSAEKRPVKSGRPMWVKWVSLAAAFILIFGGVIVGTQVTSQAAVDSVVALDVNPSMEIEINKNQKVIKVNALNEDAEKVLEGLDLKKVDIKVAVYAIIGSMHEKGYLTAERNSILISVDSKNEARASELQAAVSESIGSILGKNNIDASVISQSYGYDEDVRKMAKENDISVAKATLIKKIIAAGLADSNGVPYTYEALAHMNVNDLKLLLEAKNANIGGINSSGTAADNFIGEQRAYEIALEHANVASEAVKKIDIELDYEKGKMVYSVEFETEKYEYEYEIDAVSGEIVEIDEPELRDDDFDDDWDDDDWDDDDDDDWDDDDRHDRKHRH